MSANTQWAEALNPTKLERRPKSYRHQYLIPSDSSPQKKYMVSENWDGTWECSCVGWTQHFPRKDCRHIRHVQSKEYMRDHRIFRRNPVLRPYDQVQLLNENPLEQLVKIEKHGPYLQLKDQDGCVLIKGTAAQLRSYIRKFKAILIN